MGIVRRVAGEGGEYETFVVDCPLFRFRIVLEETRKCAAAAPPEPEPELELADIPLTHSNFTRLACSLSPLP